ncbi:hypothetical protein CDAR_224241 [Caerostris darwini]|uniref:Uncharacterized protein n=1 Tax=Caerostris darwini TaxID=1538125 RepID=A0AAV4Q760_9ARAC|nr:hypothetical protein CDAR_224241 [Caerostris darwini]
MKSAHALSGSGTGKARSSPEQSEAVTRLRGFFSRILLRLVFYFLPRFVRGPPSPMDADPGIVFPLFFGNNFFPVPFDCKGLRWNVKSTNGLIGRQLVDRLTSYRQRERYKTSVMSKLE